MGKYAVFNEITFLHIVNMQGGKVMLMLKIHIYVVYIQHALLHVPSLCPRTGCCSRAHTTGNDFSGVFVFVFRHFESSSHAHTIFKNIKTVELWIQCCYAVVVVYMYVMYIVDMYFICFCCCFSFQLVGGKTRECCWCLWGVVETWWFFFV